MGTAIRRFHLGLRVTAYMTGLIGMVLFAIGKQDAGARTWMMVVGAALLGVSFVCFLASYAIFVLSRLGRTHTPPGSTE